MAKNISLLGANYPDVPAVTLPQTGGGSALFTDVSDTDSLAENVERGKIFYNASGVKCVGVLDKVIPIDTHVDPTTGRWVRPQEYPDLDAIDYGNNKNICYMTYDLRKTPGYAWIGVYVYGESGNYNIDRGHLENDVFVVDEAHSVAMMSYFRQDLDPANGDVQLWRITTANKNITGFGFCTNSTSNSTVYHNQMQPCVERKGYFDYSSIIWGDSGTGSTYKKHCTMWMERDALVMGRAIKLTSLGGGWSGAYNLVDIDFSEWDASKWVLTTFGSNWSWCMSLQSLDLSWMQSSSNWKVTNFSGNWSHCHSLKALDITHFDTSNWAVTNFSANWAYCLSLVDLDLSNFDTSKWAVNQFNDSWTHCRSLKSLKIGNFDTSNWVVTNINSTWANCHNLSVIPVEGWDTSKWAVTNFGSTFTMCLAVKKLDLHNWNTSNWTVTNFGSAFSACLSLQVLDISTWDVSKWRPTSLGSVWNSCYCLKELKLNSWDTSDWAPTSLASTWSNDMSLEVLEIDSWDTSNWAITALNNAWYQCVSLKELRLNNWNTSNWAVTTMRQMLYYCVALEKFEASSWDTSNWAVTDLYYAFFYNAFLKSLDISGWDTTNWDVTTSSYLFNNEYALETLLTPASFHLRFVSANNSVPNSYAIQNFSGYDVQWNHSYSSAYKLTKQSLINILNRLPTISTTKTITLGATNYNKLTVEQIAVATQKGWTVAR